MKRKTIQVDVDYISIYDLEGLVDNIIQRFEKLKQENKGNELIISLETDYITDEKKYSIYYMRDETDQEFNIRKLREKKEREAKKIKKEESERKLYKKLKKKFEG
jgi:protein tyrosine phosphatase